MKRFMALLIAAIMLAATSASIWADSDPADTLPAEDETTAVDTEPAQDEPAAPAEDDFDDAELTAAAANKVEYTDDNIIGGSIYYDPTSGTIVDCDENVISCVVPSMIGGIKITAIGSSAFYSTDVVEVTLPDTILDIGERAFQSSTSLQTINIPDSVTSIGNYAFYGTKIKSVSTETSCTIGNFAFSRSSLESIYAPNAKSIGSGAFSGCSSLSDVVLTSITAVPSLAFANCSDLLNIELPSAVTAIGEQAFDHAGLSGNFTLPESLKTIGKRAFYQSDLQGKLVIPSSVTDIGVESFYGTRIIEVVVPGSVTNISDGAFGSCQSLIRITLEEGIVSVGKRAFHHSDKKSYTVWLPASLQYVSEEAFETGFKGYGTSSLKVYYAACINKFNEIIFGDNNNDITGGEMYYYNDAGKEHDYQYKYDTDSHWLACKDCGIMSGEKEFHVMDGDACKVCGFGSSGQHVHSYVYKSDVNVHWQYCEACGDTCNVEEHTFENGTCKYCGSAKAAAGGLNGDMDNDGKITLNDAVLVLKIAMNVA